MISSGVPSSPAVMDSAPMYHFQDVSPLKLLQLAFYWEGFVPPLPNEAFTSPRNLARF